MCFFVSHKPKNKGPCVRSAVCGNQAPALSMPLLRDSSCWPDIAWLESGEATAWKPALFFHRLPFSKKDYRYSTLIKRQRKTNDIHILTLGIDRRKEDIWGFKLQNCVECDVCPQCFKDKLSDNISKFFVIYICPASGGWIPELSYLSVVFVLLSPRERVLAE